MKMLGEHVDGLDFPVCNAFEKKIIDGELCYELEFKTLLSRGNVTVQAGRGKGLLLAIDNGISIEPHPEDNDSEVKRDFIRTELVSRGKRAKLHILTTHRHDDSRPGVYTLKNLKQMKGKKNFMAMPDDLKGCQTETTEICRGRRYVQEVQMQCGCLPWKLSPLVPEQVFSSSSIEEEYSFIHAIRLTE